MNEIKIIAGILLLSILMIVNCTRKRANDPTKTSVVDTLSVFSSSSSDSTIHPLPSNPYYWQYKGKPVMLLGGSDDDNIFQDANLKAQLDLMKQVGANYIRNVMSGRDNGDVKPFKKLANGKYDLNQWNEAYWDRFKNLLQLADKRQIFVQIELWDQWDHNEDRWNSDPWNPEHNVNYTTSNTQLKGDGNYGNVYNNTDHKHDFFLTEPEIHNDKLVLKYQRKFIDKVLSFSFQYGNILYTVTNELFDQHPSAWSIYWIDYVKKEAQKTGKSVEITEMFQEENIKGARHRSEYEKPNIFDFEEISQNSTKSNQKHWDNLEWVRKYIAARPRPLNNTKTYGSDELKWTDGDKQGIERFWRNIIGGAASVRFHRPDAGLGLSPKAQTQIRSARMFLSEFNIFKAKPDVNSSLLSRRDANEAYLTYQPGTQYAVYFPTAGNVKLDLRDVQGSFKLQWLNINKSKWNSGSTFNANRIIKLDTPEKGSWIALIKTS